MVSWPYSRSQVVNTLFIYIVGKRGISTLSPWLCVSKEGVINVNGIIPKFSTLDGWKPPKWLVVVVVVRVRGHGRASLFVAGDPVLAVVVVVVHVVHNHTGSHGRHERTVSLILAF